MVVVTDVVEELNGGEIVVVVEVLDVVVLVVAGSVELVEAGFVDVVVLLVLVLVEVALVVVVLVLVVVLVVVGGVATVVTVAVSSDEPWMSVARVRMMPVVVVLDEPVSLRFADAASIPALLPVRVSTDDESMLMSALLFG